MIFDGIRQPNTIYVASVSRGKDSTAMLRAIQLMGFPLDAICAVDIWFDKDTPAELPPMVAFKNEWDKKCFEHFGIPVTRLCATKRERMCFCDYFYRERTWSGGEGKQYNIKPGTTAIYGFPVRCGAWCNSRLKVEPQSDTNLLRHLLVGQTTFSLKPQVNKGQKINIVHYIGIAADEPERIARHIVKPNVILPLVQIGWDEDLCGLEATYLDMLSPTYENVTRDGCWFCHNQSVNQLRLLRKNYPDLWAKLMQLDLDSPVTFHADGHTIHDFDKRFQLEDEGWIKATDKWRWDYLKCPPSPQITFFDKGE